MTNRLDQPKPSSIADALKELRRRLGLTVAMAADKCGMSAFAWGMLERGETTPDKETADRIHDGTGIDVYAMALTMHDYENDDKTPEPLKSACEGLKRVSGEIIERRIAEQTKTELN